MFTFLLTSRLEPTMGIGPMTSSLPKRCAAAALRGQVYKIILDSGHRMGNAEGIQHLVSSIQYRIWWREVDSNYRSVPQQIYSLLPLTTRESRRYLIVARRKPKCKKDQQYADKTRIALSPTLGRTKVYQTQMLFAIV